MTADERARADALRTAAPASAPRGAPLQPRELPELEPLDWFDDDSTLLMPEAA